MIRLCTKEIKSCHTYFLNSCGLGHYTIDLFLNPSDNCTSFVTFCPYSFNEIRQAPSPSFLKLVLKLIFIPCLLTQHETLFLLYFFYCFYIVLMFYVLYFMLLFMYSTFLFVCLFVFPLVLSSIMAAEL